MTNVDKMREALLSQDRSYDDTRSQCLHCGNYYQDGNTSYDDAYCSSRCWHLENIGEFKYHIKNLLCRFCGTQTFLEMERWDWFDGVSDSSVGRYRSLLFGLDRRLTNGGKISAFGELISG